MVFPIDAGDDTTGGIVVLGLIAGTSFFRSLFYLPSLLAGVAMFLLWKTLYRPEGGLINAGLRPLLASVQSAVTSTPAWLWHGAGLLVWGLTAAWALWLIGIGVSRLAHRDSGIASFLGRLGVIGTIGRRFLD